MREFHINRKIRDTYHFDERLYELDGNVAFVDIQSVRKFIQQITSRLDEAQIAEKNLTASQINAMGLIDEILHYVFAQYRLLVNPKALEQVEAHLIQVFGAEKLTLTLTRFCEEFPPVPVYQGKLTLNAYLNDPIDGPANRLATIEEVILLWLANTNPAFMQYGEFFDDSELKKQTIYPSLITSIQEYFSTQPVFGPDNQDILTLLHSPVVVAPYSLTDQLAYIREKWAIFLKDFLLRILGGLDLIKEEQRAIFGGPGPAHIPDYQKLRSLMDLDKEQFSPDSDWMPRVVLIAKNSYVWLYQLTRKYGREIYRLDQIPDEELDFLSQAGITGLWLIGLWERSKASENIKRMCGNPEAVASAYSIAKYQIAEDLGGELALQNLKQRAWQRGIRLASDMVPNHMGIDSDWLTHEPDDFIALDHSPFPSYTFNGQNLSRDPGIGIFLEDHYYNRTDASVVFKWVDFHTGREKFIYHGNDGTNMPWNDTAQLNYLLSDVREKVIQQILQVARNFPIIRFDAAMTLAKKHYQRLWFPEPGSGGDIPTRSQNALSKGRFDELFPVEFWREVVDRTAREVPDTLLLAEAFWLMEGYFVRTLGMHRVYNSAFMNMMRNEENAKYRSVIKNTIEFDPDILKRFVNFMNNPDERTAVEQFGKGDKYFGICLLMVTLPGLPMLGHGQIEGYSEKYGMEYRRAYLDENPDHDLVSRHQREIFPLIHQRHLFSGVELFRMYDFYRSDGSVDEDVFAFSNGIGSNRNLILFLNKFASSEGTINQCSVYLRKSDGIQITESLAQNFGLHADNGYFTILHDEIQGLDNLIPSSKIAHQGLHLHLNAYQYYAFTNIHELKDDDGILQSLYQEIGETPVYDLQARIRLIRFRSLHQAFSQLIHPDILGLMNPKTAPVSIENQLHDLLTKFLDEFNRFYPISDVSKIKVEEKVQTWLQFLRQLSSDIFPPAVQDSVVWYRYSKGLQFAEQSPQDLLLIWTWIILNSISDATKGSSRALTVSNILDEFSLDTPLLDALSSSGLSNNLCWFEIGLLRSISGLGTQSDLLITDPGQFWQSILNDKSNQIVLGFNQTEGYSWVHQEAMERYCLWLERLSMLNLIVSKGEWTIRIENWLYTIKGLEGSRKALLDSGCRLDQFLGILKDQLYNGS